MEGEEKKKKDKNKLKKLFGNKSKKAPDNFTLSSPVNFRQTAHVGFDPTTGEFEGMPKEWSVLLLTSGLKKDDYSHNPQTLLKVLEYQQEYLSSHSLLDNISPRPMTPPPPPVPLSGRRVKTPDNDAESKDYNSILEEQRKKQLPPLPPAPPIPGEYEEDDLDDIINLHSNEFEKKSLPPLPDLSPDVVDTIISHNKNAETKTFNNNDNSYDNSDENNYNNNYNNNNNNNSNNNNNVNVNGNANKNVSKLTTLSSMGNLRQTLDFIDRVKPTTSNNNNNNIVPNIPLSSVNNNAQSATVVSPRSQQLQKGVLLSPHQQLQLQQQQQQQTFQQPQLLAHQTLQPPLNYPTPSLSPPLSSNSNAASLSSQQQMQQQQLYQQQLLLQQQRQQLLLKQQEEDYQKQLLYQQQQQQYQQQQQQLLLQQQKQQQHLLQQQKLQYQQQQQLQHQQKQQFLQQQQQYQLSKQQQLQQPLPLQPQQQQQNNAQVLLSPKRDMRQKGAPSVSPEVYRILEPFVSKDDPTNIYIDQYTIGQGSSGTVTVAIDLRTNEKVAVKKMVLAHGVNQVDTLESELYIMKNSKHKNIVNYIDSYIVGNSLWCVMEYMDGGDLTEVIRVCRNRYKESQIATILREVLEGLKYLHSLPQPIVHRDIKSDNVLLALDGRVKLTDFGFGAQLTSEKSKRNSIIGTTYWMAPEVITSRDYDTKIDVWSVGILAQEIVEGEPPYMEESAVKALYLIASQGRAPFKDPNRLSPAFKNFVKQCTIMDPNKRPTCAQLLKHPFITTACSNEGLIPIVKATQEALASEWEEF